MARMDKSTRITETPDEQYDLMSVLHNILEAAATYEVYIQDAKAAQDNELADFFSKLQQEDLQRAERAKQLLAKRMSKHPVGVR